MFSGTLTLVSLDLPESARLLEFSPTVLSQAITFCNEAIQDLAAGSKGEVHSYLSIEDSLLASFRTASAALEATSLLHRSLLQQPWHPPRCISRSALVTGDIESQGESLGDATLLTLQAMRELARPGQILVSEATHAVVRQNLSEGHGFLNLGVHHLDDGQRAQSLFQLLHPELPATFQPLPTLLTAASNLPSGTTRIIGRHAEVRDVKSAFFESRVVSLIGFAGVGKSRLAIRVAFEMLEDHYHGSCYVDLARTTTETQIYQIMASNLGVHEAPGVTFEHAVVEKLRASEMLLLFDNADQAMQPLVRVIGRIVDLCPRVQVLNTSRKPLALPNVRDYTVRPLELPTLSDLHNLETLSEVESVALFTNRASLLQGGFELTHENAESIARLCRKLDGIPLAIELAAAKLVRLDIARIVDGLEDRFSLLRKGRGSGARLTLEEAVRWSYDILSESERYLLQRLTVFSGAFSVESALAIGADAAPSKSEALRILGDLVGAAFVRQETPDGSYLSVLDTIREFARGALIESRRIHEAMDRHADWFAQRAQDIAHGPTSAEQSAYAEELDRTYMNFSSALDWSLGSQADDRSPKLIIGLSEYWHLRSRFAEGLTLTEQVLREDKAMRGELRGRLHVIAGNMASGLGQSNRAEKHFSEAKLIGKREHSLALQYSALESSGTNLVGDGQPEKACSILKEALAIAKHLGSEDEIANCLNSLGNAFAEAGRHEEAGKVLCEALEISSKLEKGKCIGTSHYCLGRSARQRGMIDEAAGHLEAAILEFADADDQRGVSASLRELGFLRVMTHSYHSAAVLLGSEGAIRRSLGQAVPQRYRAEMDRMLEHLKDALGSHFLCEFERGAEMRLPEIKEFLLLPNSKETQRL